MRTLCTSLLALLLVSLSPAQDRRPPTGEVPSDQANLAVEVQSPAVAPLSPITKDIVDAVGKIAPQGQMTPEAARRLQDLALRLEAGASIFDYGLYAMLLLSLAYVLNGFRVQRIAAGVAACGFGCSFMIPFVQFSLISLVGVVACLVVILRKNAKTEPAGSEC